MRTLLSRTRTVIARTTVGGQNFDQPNADQNPTEGDLVSMKVFLPATMDDTKPFTQTVEVLQTLDQSKHKFVWHNDTTTPDVLSSKRTEKLTEKGKDKTVYETEETFTGSEVPDLKKSSKAKLDHAFDEMAKALKKEVEKAHDK